MLFLSSNPVTTFPGYCPEMHGLPSFIQVTCSTVDIYSLKHSQNPLVPGTSDYPEYWAIPVPKRQSLLLPLCRYKAWALLQPVRAPE